MMSEVEGLLCQKCFRRIDRMYWKLHTDACQGPDPTFGRREAAT